MYDRLFHDKLSCCMGCDKWYEGSLFIKMFDCGVAFFLCPKCAKKLEREIASWHGKLSRKKKEGAEHE